MRVETLPPDLWGKCFDSHSPHHHPPSSASPPLQCLRFPIIKIQLFEQSCNLWQIQSPQCGLTWLERGRGLPHHLHPSGQGRHDLTVKVNGQDIAGSPFRVFFKIHPIQLGPPVPTMTGMKRPWGIVINNKQLLLVTEYGGKKLSISERDGKTLQTIESDKLQCPRGVATGPDGVYVTDTGTHCLLKFDKDGRLLKTVKNEFQSMHTWTHACTHAHMHTHTHTHTCRAPVSSSPLLTIDCTCLSMLRT